MINPNIDKTRTESVIERIHIAQNLVKINRAQGLNALNDLFRSGTAPSLSLDGRYAGELIALDVAPGLTQIAQAVCSVWMPWKGKTFDASRSEGINIFHRSSYALAHIFWPLYRGYQDDTVETYRAFAFHTYIAPGKADPDREVLKIDYDILGNPGASIRRVLDELVQVDEGYYLGKAHLKWWTGTWQMVAYFSLHTTNTHE